MRNADLFELAKVRINGRSNDRMFTVSATHRRYLRNKKIQNKANQTTNSFKITTTSLELPISITNRQKHHTFIELTYSFLARSRSRDNS